MIRINTRSCEIVSETSKYIILYFDDPYEVLQDFQPQVELQSELTAQIITMIYTTIMNNPNPPSSYMGTVTGYIYASGDLTKTVHLRVRKIKP